MMRYTNGHIYFTLLYIFIIYIIKHKLHHHIIKPQKENSSFTSAVSWLAAASLAKAGQLPLVLLTPVHGIRQRCIILQ